MIEPLAASYVTARDRFLAAATAVGADVTAHRHPEQHGPEGVELAIDVAELGPSDATNVLLIVSGTHGVEGYAGSALQTGWLKRRATERPAPLRVVLVHGFNPFGFAWHRRTNEDNVDLNRNFVDWTAPPPINAGYDDLAPLLVPERWDEDAKAASTAQLLVVAERIGLEDLQRAITGGQYRHPDGLFYGGTGPVWSNRWLAEHAEPMLGAATRLGIIDLHTGLGPWGIGELIAHVSAADPGYGRAEQWWGEVRSMTDGESVSAKLSGDWLGRIGDLLPNVEITAAALEFGTIDEVSVLQALRAEAWVHGNAERLSPEAEAARSVVRAAFADEDPAWIAMLAERFDDVATAAVKALVG